MQIYRFDDEVSIPVSDFGGRFAIGPLTSDTARGRLQLLRLPPNGLIGRHRALRQQLFAVVAGHGWVAGEDGSRRDVGPGYAALWEQDEEHEAGTVEGLTAISFEGQFEMWALAVTVTKEIVVEEYDPNWPHWFETILARVWPAVAHAALRIDHVGSTSVPGLAAKPIIDMDIVVADETGLRPVISALEGLGYRWRGELGIEGRHAFGRPSGDVLPEHHLYLVIENNKAHLDHWLLRDLLRKDPEARDRYAALKRQNAAESGNDMDVYVARKAALVAELLTRARADGGFPPATYWVP